MFDETEAIEKVAEKLQIEHWKIDDPELYASLTVPAFVSKLNPEILWKHKTVPLKEVNGKIVTAFANPLDHEIKQLLEFTLGKKLTVVIAEEAKIQRLLGEHCPPSKMSIDEMNSVDVGDSIEVVNQSIKDQDLDVSSPDAPPIIKLCNKILADAVRAEASDIHIEPLQFGLEVRFRVDGMMQSVMEVPKRLQPYIITRFKLLAGMDISEKRRPQDGRVRIKVQGETLDLRASSVPAAYGEKMVFRLLRSDSVELSFESLGFPDTLRGAITKALDAHGKLFLVTGPTGSGKTTTLYTCLNYLKDGTSNIETVEDPVEYRIPGINQIQINESINVTFASALRSILRQDPDVIMIGEIRDTETAQIAMQAAQTGHQVLSTLHTNSAPAAISRLLNLGIQPYIIASSLAGVLAQRLVRKICAACAKPLDQVQQQKHAEIIAAHKLETSKLQHAPGCKDCNFTGYRGRLGVYSYLEINDAITNLIHDQSSLPQLVREARKTGYQDLSDAALELVKSGSTTLDEVKSLLVFSEQSEPVLDRLEVGRPSQIPAAKSSAAGLDKDIAQQKMSGIHKQKIVLIEDDEDVRRILSMLLKNEMFETYEAKDGREGLEQVYQHNPDIILCDLMMPGMDGREFLLKMKTHEQTRKIPVIILTAADTEENETGLLDLGAKDFLSKASSSKVMLSRIRRVLGS